MGMVDRMVGAARLNVATYEEVEGDVRATGQAMVVVVLSSVAAGIGSSTAGIFGLISVAFSALVGWFVWAGITFLLGTRVLPEPQTRSDVGELLRTTGFASAPGILRIVGVIPLLGGLLNLVIMLWMLAAMVVAVRQALDYRSTGRAIFVCFVGWIVYLAANLVLRWVFGIRIL